MSPTAPVYLKDLQTGDQVEAALVNGMTVDQVARASAAWQLPIDQRRQDLIDRRAPEDEWPEHLHWDWERKARAVDGLLSYRLFGVQHEGQCQGLMLVAIDGHLARVRDQRGKPLIYVHYLATAPWNSREFVAVPRFSGVGSILVAAAVHTSFDEGFRGRIGLHSLPRAEEFYRRCEMTDLGLDQECDDLRYFEMTTQQAAQYLGRKG